MQIAAKVEYGVRAMLVLAVAEKPLTTDEIAKAQDLPSRFLGAIMTDLRRAELVASQRGVSGGYRLARPAEKILLAEIMRALDGPLAGVRGDRPEQVGYEGSAKHLQDVWIAARAALRQVLDHVTLAEIASGNLPEAVTNLTRDPQSWISIRG
jgi:Rrf2 family protein